MVVRDEWKDRASNAACLEQRIAKNQGSQQTDLVSWIFERIAVSPGCRALELCSGTGNQSLKLADLIGPGGHLTALDVSEEALEKLEGKLDQTQKERVTTVPGPMDELPRLLEERGLGLETYDLIFCAYGLYYSEAPEGLLRELARRLSPGGRMVVAGPFGPNNGPLFRMLKEAGAEIPEYVLYTSSEFMEEQVIPFANRYFQRNVVHILLNSVEWNRLEDVYDYWKNTTFYDEKRAERFHELLENHFHHHSRFVNEKWVMMIEMNEAR